jgi:histidinol-phosphate/aromatic aminotransferase/cobyric acid decarboxylase-like protein
VGNVERFDSSQAREAKRRRCTVRVAKGEAHGGNGRIVAEQLGIDPDSILDLSMSLNPFAPDPTPVLLKHLAAGAARRYPDERDRDETAAVLAQALGVAVERVLLTNGGAEAIALVAAELGRGWVEEPEFSLYRRHLAVLDPDGPRFRSDPNNPTGRLATNPDATGVWDEAFYPLATGRWSGLGGPGAVRSPGSVVVGSLTKVLAIPGIRLGYIVVPEDDGAAVGTPDLYERLAVRQPEWPVGTLALLTCRDLIEQSDVAAWAAAVGQARGDLVTVLGRFGLHPEPSDANFVLVPRAQGLRQTLARLGIVVRDAGSFGLIDHVRIAVPGPEGLTRLEAALAHRRDTTAVMST